MDQIAVLIPCYNEAQTIGKVVRDFKTCLPEAVIYVYDNASTDDTAKLAKRAGAVVRHEYKRGKGNVIRRMFREVEAECVIMVDGDDTYPAEAAREMAEQVLYRNADMVVGDRLSSTYFAENKRLFHNSGNTLVRRLINALFHTEIKDIMTGYRAFGYAFVKTFPVLSQGFEIETEMSIHAADKNLSIANVIVDYRDRPEGSSSKLHTVRDGIRVLRMILRLFSTYRPLVFYSSVSAVLLLLSVFFGVPVIGEYLETGLVLRFPTLFTCGFALLAALISFFSGLILETMARTNRQNFEILLNRVYREQVQSQKTGTGSEEGKNRIY